MKEEFSENYINIGLKVSYFRKRSGLTQEQLAEKMGVGTSFIGQIVSDCQDLGCAAAQIS